MTITTHDERGTLRHFRTRGGLPVRIYAVEPTGNYPVHGAVNMNGVWESYQWTANGAVWAGTEHEEDLTEVEAPSEEQSNDQP